MFLKSVGLLVALLVIAIAMRLIVDFWIWLSKGEKSKRYMEEGEDDTPEVEHARQVDEDFWCRRRRRKLKREGQELPPKHGFAEVLKAHFVLREHFMDHLKLGWYQFVMLFFIASILGLIIEEVWMYITEGLTESRVGLVWGPFSPLYGSGAIILTLIFFYMRKKGAKWWLIFIVSMAVGGLLEQIVGWGMYTFMGASSWDYSAVPGAITQWVAVPFLFFWGILGLVWAKILMPEMLFAIGKKTTKRQAVFITLLSVYLIADIFMTLACFERLAERGQGIPPSGPFEEWIDTHYSDEFIENRFENMKIE